MQDLSVRPTNSSTRIALTAPATLEDVLSALADDKATPLAFEWENQLTKHGYHITEIKSGDFTSLDCGANPERWSETILQLWNVDGDADGRTMTVGKTRSILSVVEKKIGLDTQARLSFEVSDGVSPIALYRPIAVRNEPDRTVVELAPVASSCKPRDRWLAGTPTAADEVALKKTRQPASGCCAKSGSQGAC
jgi:Family of unknown function (DUF6428)